VTSTGEHKSLFQGSNSACRNANKPVNKDVIHSLLFQFLFYGNALPDLLVVIGGPQ